MTPATGTVTVRRSQSQRRSESERRILDAAVELVSWQGVERTSLAQIGDKAGTSRGLPGYLFGSKRELLRHMAMDLQRHWAGVIGERLPAGTGMDEITNYVERYFELLFSPKGKRYLGAMMGIVAAEAAGVADAEGLGREINDRLRRALERLIEAGIADGSIRPSAGARAESALIVAQLRGITLDWLIDRQTVMAAAQRDAVVAHMRRALEAPG
ncbi:MAG: TetR/AcrR family transcriptional regulator [Acidimicrobiales bacterium]